MAAQAISWGIPGVSGLLLSKTKKVPTLQGASRHHDAAGFARWRARRAPQRMQKQLPGGVTVVAAAGGNNQFEDDDMWVGDGAEAAGPWTKVERQKGIFDFVVNNASSKGAIQLTATPAEDGNLGQMISQIEGKGRDFGSYVEVGELQWFVRETGTEKSKAGTVLLLHGAPTQSYSFRQVMQQMSEKGYRCIAPDWIGFGFSDMPQPGYGFSYKEEAYHDELNKLLDTLGITGPIFVVVQGFIMGQYGLTWALKNSSRVKKIGILNTPLTPSASLPTPLASLKLPFVGEFAAQNAILAERFIEGGSPYVLENDDADVYRLPYLDSSAAGFALLEVVRKYTQKDVAESIKSGFSSSRWKIPVVVAWGDKDKYLPESEMDAFAAANSDVIEKRLLEAAGHMPQEDWPEKVVEAFHNFFRK